MARSLLCCVNHVPIPLAVSQYRYHTAPIFRFDRGICCYCIPSNFAPGAAPPPQPSVHSFFDGHSQRTTYTKNRAFTIVRQQLTHNRKSAVFHIRPLLGMPIKKTVIPSIWCDTCIEYVHVRARIGTPTTGSQYRVTALPK